MRPRLRESLATSCGQFRMSLMPRIRRENRSTRVKDPKTSSSVKTPPEVRSIDGALFCASRYGKVFVYHNGAQSYYAAMRGRGSLRL